MLRQTTASFLLLFASCDGLAQDSVSEWLAKMDASQRSLNYEGVLSYQYAGSAHSLADRVYGLRVRHYIKDGLEYDHIETLDGPEQEIVREGHDVNCVHAGPKLIQRSMQSSQSGYKRYYDVDVGGAGRVADRDTVRLEIRPKDVYRLGYLLSLDKETGLLLQSEIVDQQGRVLERFQYLMVNLEPSSFDELTAQRLMPSQARSQLASQENATHLETHDGRDAEPLPWQPSWLPAGFTLAQSDGQFPEGLSYTDGMAVFSIFVDSLMAANNDTLLATEGVQRRGASVSYTTTLPDHQALVTVVGEIPLLTARQVATSLVWVN